MLAVRKWNAVRGYITDFHKLKLARNKKKSNCFVVSHIQQIVFLRLHPEAEERQVRLIVSQSSMKVSKHILRQRHEKKFHTFFTHKVQGENMFNVYEISCIVSDKRPEIPVLVLDRLLQYRVSRKRQIRAIRMGSSGPEHFISCFHFLPLNVLLTSDPKTVMTSITSPRA